MFWRPECCLHFAREAAFFIAELQRSHSIAVHGDIDVRRIGVEGRTGHEQSLAMRVHTFAKELNVSLEKTVTGDFYPDKVEIVFVKPDVFSDGRDGIGGAPGESISYARRHYVRYSHRVREITS